MKRRFFGSLLCLVFLAASPAWAQPPGDFSHLVSDVKDPEDPYRVWEKWIYGLYDNPKRAEAMITPDFLSGLSVDDPYFVAAVRLFYTSNQAFDLYEDPPRTRYLSQLGIILFHEVNKRGDAVMPVLLQLLDGPDDYNWKLGPRILMETGAVRTIDLEPLVNYVRNYLREHPGERISTTKRSDYESMNSVITNLGDEADIPLLEGRDVVFLDRMKERLEKEKKTGVTRLEQRRKRCAYEIALLDRTTKPQPAQKSTTTHNAPNAPHGDGISLLWIIAALIGVALVVAFATRINR